MEFVQWRGGKMKEVDVITEAVIERPRGEVADFAMDPDRAPVWYENIREVAWKTEPPLRIGSRVAFVARFLTRELRYTYEVTEMEPGERLVMRTSQGPFPMETTYQFESLGESQTRMTLRNRGNPSGFFRLLSPFLATAMRRENRKDLDRLKAVLEDVAG